MEDVKTKRSFKLPARAGIWNIISGLAARGVGVLATPIFTRLLTPTEYGLYPLYTTWLSLLSAVIVTALAGSATYRGLEIFGCEKDKFIRAAYGFSLCGSGIALAAVLLLRAPISELSGLSPAVLTELVLECALSAVIAVKSAQLRFEYKYKPLAFINLFSALSAPLLSILFIYFTPFRETARISASLLTTMILAAPIITKSLAQGSLYDGRVWRYLARTSLPMVPHYLSSATILRISEMVVGRTHGQAALAKYSVGISVGLALTFLANALIQVISPWVIRKLARGEVELIESVVTPALKLIILASLFIMALAPEMLSLITTEEYSDALLTVYPLALSVPAMLLSGVAKSAESYYDRGIKSSLPTVATAGLTALSAIAILPRTDYRLAALLTLAAYITLSALSLRSFQKVSSKALISPIKCTLLFTFSALYGGLMLLARNLFMLRLILLIPPALLAYYVSKQVLSIIKE